MLRQSNRKSNRPGDCWHTVRRSVQCSGWRTVTGAWASVSRNLVTGGKTMSATASQTPVNTFKVSGRRKLRFQCCDDILKDCEGLLGGYRQLGNWSLGKM